MGQWLYWHFVCGNVSVAHTDYSKAKETSDKLFGELAKLNYFVPHDLEVYLVGYTGESLPVVLENVHA